MQVTPVDLSKSNDDDLSKLSANEPNISGDVKKQEAETDHDVSNAGGKVNSGEPIADDAVSVDGADSSRDGEASDESSGTYDPIEVVDDSKQENEVDSEHSPSRPVDNNDKEEDDYDPESIDLPTSYTQKDANLENTSEEIDVYRHPEDTVGVQEEEADDYDPEIEFSNSENPSREPERSIEPSPSSHTTSKLKPPPAGLPPKPPVSANFLRGASQSPNNPQKQLKEAYDAIMNSELVKDPGFVNLSQKDQMKLIMEQLSKKNVNIRNIPSNAQQGSMNYNQVYSYNKPFKNLKNPIPLVPVNEYCRRPNITAPMSSEEDAAYDDFIKRESEYMKLQNWDEFPEKSRLFIGNLPANTISKQDLFRIFSQYGEVIQIAIKAGYGFAQFRTAESCLDCIKGETNVPLHNKIMRLDASSPQKSKRQGRNDSNNFSMTSRGRDRSPDSSNGDDGNKRRKQTPDCKIYVTGKSSVFFIRKVKKSFSSVLVSVDTEDITHRDLSDVISEAAYSGVIGICIVKEQKVDVQIFENTEDGGIKFDEYADIEPELAADIISKAKIKKYGNNLPQQPKTSPRPYYNNFQTGSNEPYNSRRNDYGNHRRIDRHSDRGNGNGQYGNNGRGNWSQPFDRNLYGDPTGMQYPPSNQYSQNSPAPYGKAPQPPNNTSQVPKDPTELLNTLQSLDPASMQSMISILQQHQHQQQSSQSPSIPPINYGQSNGQSPLTSSNQVNAILSHLQSAPNNFIQGSVNQAQYQNQNQSQSQSSTTQSLMETLARLGRK